MDKWDEVRGMVLKLNYMKERHEGLGEDRVLQVELDYLDEWEG